mmetsp:Transcript_26418/g.61025  ORF Transcript_26418/g.61025 Transcript_26418/m.61025 type:complete len:270 (+) Transcript_26418:1041-1850(+)
MQGQLPWNHSATNGGSEPGCAAACGPPSKPRGAVSASTPAAGSPTASAVLSAPESLAYEFSSRATDAHVCTSARCASREGIVFTMKSSIGSKPSSGSTYMPGGDTNTGHADAPRGIIPAEADCKSWLPDSCDDRWPRAALSGLPSSIRTGREKPKSGTSAAVQPSSDLITPHPVSQSVSGSAAAAGLTLPADDWPSRGSLCPDTGPVERKRVSRFGEAEAEGVLGKTSTASVRAAAAVAVSSGRTGRRYHASRELSSPELSSSSSGVSA